MIPEYPPIPNESSIECDSEMTEFEFEFYEDLNYFFTLIIDNGK